MMTRCEVAPAATFVDRRVQEDQARQLPRVMRLLWAGLCSTWIAWMARKRLQRSIAHLDDRLLADIGLSAQDLGMMQRFLRGNVACAGLWSLGQTRSRAASGVHARAVAPGPRAVDRPLHG